MKMNNDKINKIKELTKNMRRVILETSLNCGEPAHLGGALSIVDVLAVLYDSVISVNLKKPSDRFRYRDGGDWSDSTSDEEDEPTDNNSHVWPLLNRGSGILKI